MKGCLAVLALATGCTQVDLDIVVRRQSATLDKITDASWTLGSAVLVGAPGTFSFPQPLSLRFSLVDGGAEYAEGVEPTLQPINKGELEPFGTPASEIKDTLTCQPTHCDAELTLTALGTTIVEVSLTNTNGTEEDCFYFAVLEDADPTGAGEALRADVEVERTKCEQALLE